jgi:hypothetical protein
MLGLEVLSGEDRIEHRLSDLMLSSHEFAQLSPIREKWQAFGRSRVVVVKTKTYSSNGKSAMFLYTN